MHNDKECCGNGCCENEQNFSSCWNCTPKINAKAPYFEAEAYHNEEIKNIKLSNYKGKWVVLFFYPADFTFVCPTELEDLAHHYE